MRWLGLRAFALLLCAAALTACVAEPASTTQPLAGQTQPAATSTVVATIAPAPTKAPASPRRAAAKRRTAKVTKKKSARNPKLYPNPRLTPGAVFPVTTAQISVRGYSSRVRNVPTSEKRETFEEYGLSYPQKPGAYECDHFIPLCLGGNNSIKNLWPEPAPQFHWKDGLEVYLLRQVRAHRITLAEAQREMRTDWYAYWVKAGKPDYSASSSASSPRVQSSSNTGAVGWSVSGTRYHRLTCAYFARIKPANRRRGTIAQAKAAGKKPCKGCRPSG